MLRRLWAIQPLTAQPADKPGPDVPGSPLLCGALRLRSRAAGRPGGEMCRSASELDFVDRRHMWFEADANVLR